MKKRKRGAPKKDKPKQVSISLRIDPEQRDQFEAAARERELSISAFLRMSALDFVKKNP